MAADLADPVVRPRPLASTFRLSRPSLGLAAWRSWSGVRRFLFVLFAVYLVKQVFFVFVFPPFSGHDEIAHFGYIRTLATEGRIPVLPDVEEWRDSAVPGQPPIFDALPPDLWGYCSFALSWDWCRQPEFANTPIYAATVAGRYYPVGYQYAANHPPLYYGLMTPFYWVSDGWTVEAQHYLFRALAVPFGLATVLLAYLMTRTLFPTDVFLAVTVPTFVAFQTQISYEAAMVNNDILAIAGYSLILYLLIRGIRDRFPRRLCLWLGVALGFALLAKGTSLTAAPVIALAVILAVGWRDVRGWIGRGALIVLPAALLSAPWYAFLYRTYGNFDALPQVAALQSWWNNPEGSFWELLTSRDFVVMRFHETWGYFGWRRIPLDPVLLWAIAIPTIVAAAGLVWYLVRAWRAARRDGAPEDPVLRPERWQWVGLVVLAVACVVAYLAIVQFGTDFVLTQARYFFPVVNAGALLLMLGLRALIPRRFHPYGQGAVFGGMVLLNLLIFTQYVVPYALSF